MPEEGFDICMGNPENVVILDPSEERGQYLMNAADILYQYFTPSDIIKYVESNG